MDDGRPSPPLFTPQRLGTKYTPVDLPALRAQVTHVPGKRLTAAEKAHVRELIQGGLTNTEIAELYSMNESTISRYRTQNWQLHPGNNQ